MNNGLILQCLRQGVVPSNFLAAARAIDVESPVFSSGRVELLTIIPDQFEFASVAATSDVLSDAASDDLLTKVVLAIIDRAGPAGGSASDDFRKLLKSPNAVKDLEARIAAHFTRVKTALDLAAANAARRAAELNRLFFVAVARRKHMESNATLWNLEETKGRLFLPPPSSP